MIHLFFNLQSKTQKESLVVLHRHVSKLIKQHQSRKKKPREKRKKKYDVMSSVKTHNEVIGITSRMKRRKEEKK